LQSLRLRPTAEAFEALVLDLADSLAGDVEGAANLVEDARVLATEAIARSETGGLGGTLDRVDLL
jgi:hypothetical protein